MSATHQAIRAPLWFAAAIAGVLAGCGGTQTETVQPAAGAATPRTPPPTATGETDETALYVAVLTPLNEAADERPITGRATFIIDETDGTMRTTLLGENLAAGIHAAYFHGSTDRTDTSCPTRNADEDGNGVVDASEVVAYAGHPMIPLNETLDPGAPFPEIADGETLISRASAPLERLPSDFRDVFGNPPLDLENGVVIVYGAAQRAETPSDVALLEGMWPAGSVPVACGEVARVG